jgi:hypothetical protein
VTGGDTVFSLTDIQMFVRSLLWLVECNNHAARNSRSRRTSRQKRMREFVSIHQLQYNTEYTHLEYSLSG